MGPEVKVGRQEGEVGLLWVCQGVNPGRKLGEVALSHSPSLLQGSGICLRPHKSLESQDQTVSDLRRSTGPQHSDNKISPHVGSRPHPSSVTTGSAHL